MKPTIDPVHGITTGDLLLTKISQCKYALMAASGYTDEPFVLYIKK
jgi:hypothetical protein